MSILNDCTTIGELVERAEHLKPSQRGRLGDVQAVEGQPGQRQGVREHHQVIISIIMDYFILIMVVFIFVLNLPASLAPTKVTKYDRMVRKKRCIYKLAFPLI